jgi:hypothetical protein
MNDAAQLRIKVLLLEGQIANAKKEHDRAISRKDLLYQD